MTLRPLFRDHTMVVGHVNICWQGMEDGAIDVRVWYENRVGPSADGLSSWVSLRFAGIEFIQYATEGIRLTTTPDVGEETAGGEPWLTVEPFGTTPQGPYVLYATQESHLLDALGGHDIDGPHAPIDRSRLIHFRIPPRP